MKKSILLFALLIWGMSGGVRAQMPVQKLAGIKNPTFYDIKSVYEDYYSKIPLEQRKGWKRYERWKYFWENRVDKDGKFPDAHRVLAEWSRFRAENKEDEISAVYNWQLLGPIDNPDGIGNVRDQGLGRINVIKVHPDNANELWIGAASGGIWKSTDGGSSWVTFPFTQFLSIGITDICFSLSNPNVVYATTGDADGSLGTGDNFYSIGLIKTTDGGNSWNVTNLSYYLTEGKLLGSVLVFPDNPDIVVVASTEGIFKSTDGGITWVKKSSGSNFRILVFHPTEAGVIYASTQSGGGSSVYCSTDAGETWLLRQTFSSVSRIALAVTPNNPDALYALCANSSDEGFNSVQYADNYAQDWISLATSSQVGNLLGWYTGKSGDRGGQGSYDLVIAVSPTNMNEIYIGGINIWKTPDAGVSWTMVTHWNGDYSKPLVHADHHALLYYGSKFYSGNDGGISYTTNSGSTWTDISSGMSITQFYRFGNSKTNPSVIIGGCQDNGTAKYDGTKWTHVYSADGMEAAVDPVNSQILYCSIYYGSLYRSTNGGNSFGSILSQGTTGESGNWVTPYIIHPSYSNMIFAGYKNIWKSSNNGSNWKKISTFSGGYYINALAVSQTDTNVIYAATSSKIYKTTNGGTNWETLSSALNPVTYITVHPTNPNRIWITLSGYSAGTKVYEYDGTNWTNISGNLPNVPVNCIAYQENSPDRLYIGTDIGVFYTDYNSASWEPFGNGLPNVIVNELEIQYSAKKLRAATYGRGIWEAPIMECNLPAVQVSVNGETTFCDGDSVVLEAQDGFSSYLWSNGETNRSIVVKESGMYSVKVINNEDCPARSQAVEIIVLPIPDIVIKVYGSPCDGDSITLSANFGFQSYLWSNEETTRQIVVRESGDYYVKIVTKDGCERVSDIFPVTFNPPPAKPVVVFDGVYLISGDAVAYQWYLEGVEISGAVSKTYLPASDGLYTVKITDENGCSSMSDPVQGYVGVENAEQVNFTYKIFPNPGKDVFDISISSPEDGAVEIKIINLIGVELEKYAGISENGFFKAKFDLDYLPWGIYFASINVNQRKVFAKIVKE